MRSATGHLFDGLPRNIMHAGGCIDGHGYTNSLEAILHSLECGEDLIELDCVTLSDAFVLAHDGTEQRFYGLSRPFHSTSFSEYQKCRVFNMYRPMDFFLLRKLLQLKSFRVVIDSKFEGKQFGSFLSFLSKELHDVIDNVIVQAYCNEDVDALIASGLEHCLLALWKFHDAEPFGPQALNFVDHAARSGLDVMGISLRYRNPATRSLNVEDVRLPALQKWNIPLFIHGQEAELTMMAAAELNSRFSLFASRSYGELPLDFDVDAYLARYADLRRFSPRAAAAHYIAFGKKEGRRYMRHGAT